jgi:hypothetical protein
MTKILTYDAKIFEDKFRRMRLSTRYWVDNLMGEVGYYPLCDAFFSICPHVQMVKRAKDKKGIVNLLANHEITDTLSKWCAENATGYWMNSNFPERVFVTDAQKGNMRWSFQNENDALLFKLTFGTMQLIQI